MVTQQSGSRQCEETCHSQGRVTRPKWMIFRKISNSMWPPPHFQKIMLQFFSESVQKKACLKVQNLQHKFLDWKWPPPFRTFPKIHPFWVASPAPQRRVTLISGCKMVASDFFLNTWKKLATQVILWGNGTWVGSLLFTRHRHCHPHCMLHHWLKWLTMTPGYCNTSYLPHNRGFHSFFGQWSHVVDYYTRWTNISSDLSAVGLCWVLAWASYQTIWICLWVMEPA